MQTQSLTCIILSLHSPLSTYADPFMLSTAEVFSSEVNDLSDDGDSFSDEVNDLFLVVGDLSADGLPLSTEVCERSLVAGVLSAVGRRND